MTKKTLAFVVYPGISLLELVANGAHVMTHNNLDLSLILEYSLS